ncbi:protein furry-like isoform X4 [Lineus longissimus]|uniref:protein furry-like isoform X4 n=1 Tax=Lineus longissimus TaxID=88925 RepID=UPI00315DC296
MAEPSSGDVSAASSNAPSSTTSPRSNRSSVLSTAPTSDGEGSRGEDPSASDTSSSAVLPWPVAGRKLTGTTVGSPDSGVSDTPGEYVLRTLFQEFTIRADIKIHQVMEEPQEKLLSKSLQRGEDPEFDQLLSSLSSVAEHCLPSLLVTLFQWYNMQNPGDESSPEHRNRAKSLKGDKDSVLLDKRDLAVDFLYCLVVVEVLKQLSYHPGHDDLINQIITQAFKHFRYKDGSQSNANAANANIISDLYAEVIGVMAQSRFQAVRKRFLAEVKEMRSKDQTPSVTHSIISLLMGMKFFRVKMHPIEEFEACIQFLQELGNYFLEVKDKDIKLALAGLFVEILLPVAAVVKNEVNVPVLKNFVEMLYQTAMDMSTKKKYCLALFPMDTCLLCVSQKTFYLQNWPYFLTMCLGHLRNKDPKMSRVALESLYRLLWVYMVRIKCESNTATQSKLQSIMNSLFPKGSKVVMPRDMPLNIFVKIIQFVAQERLDFAMKEIVFDLLCVGKPSKLLTPERMSIGLRAFLVITDSLQQQDGVPPMPQTIGVFPSGSTLRVKKTFLNTMLTEETARSIGMAPYYSHVRKAFDSILRALDAIVGKPLLLTRTENVNKEPDDMITGERKAKIDLFRTSVAAITRIIPDGMTKLELVELLARLTVHIDEELKGLACKALQNLMSDFSDWREEVVSGFIQFIQKEVSDSFPQVLETCLRMMLQLLSQWKSIVQASQKDKIDECLVHQKVNQFEKSAHAPVLNEVEGFALVMLCNCRPYTRKLAVQLLKEIRNLCTVLGTTKQVDDACVIDVLDKACPFIVEKILPHLPPQEKAAVLATNSIDLQWLADRTSPFWVSGYHDNNDSMNAKNLNFSTFDPWVTCLSTFLDSNHAFSCCPNAVAYAWPIVYVRLLAIFSYVDPNSPSGDTRTSSLLRSGSKKVTNERDLYMNLWHNYVVMSCCVAPPSVMITQRSASPELGASSSPENSSREAEKTDSLKLNVANASNLFKLLVPLIRCEAIDMRDIIADGIGRSNPGAFSDLMEELVPYIKEAIDRKQENVRRRRRRDILRVQLAKIFELMAENGTFAQSSYAIDESVTGVDSTTGVIDKESQALAPRFVEYIDGARMFLENEAERDQPILQEIRLHFSGFIRHLIRHTPVDTRHMVLSRSLRYNLFYLFASWSGKFGQAFGAMDRRTNKDDSCTELELSAIQAMGAVLCCGAAFDPSGLTEENYVYSWLDTLLESHDEKVYALAQETIVLLLEYNPDAQALLDWVIDRCYTGSNEVADGCFLALARVFTNREYPCDHVAMLNVTLLNTGNPRIHIRETALQLLQLLDRRFFLDDLVVTEPEEALIEEEEDGKMEPSLHGSAILLGATYTFCQMELSSQLAKLHPELTMPIFSEITHRLQTARYPVQHNLLMYLLPWLYNMELIDPHLPLGEPLSNFLNKLQDNQADMMKPPLRGEGWGSTQATEMVLTNLFFATVKFGDDHQKAFEVLWSALVACWPLNLKVIIRYLIIVTGMAPQDLMPYARRVVMYLGRAKPERLVDELMNEMQTVETLSYNIERTHTPPFYRLTSVKKPVGHVMETEVCPEDKEAALEKGLLHTKRHSTAEEPLIAPRANSMASLRSTSASCHSAMSNTTKEEMMHSMSTVSSTSSAPAASESYVIDDDNFATLRKASESSSSKHSSIQIQIGCDESVPYPLPMPAYGGYYAPMLEYLPDTPPSPSFHRCNMAVMLMTDLVMDAIDIDWAAHLPLMLHVIFLGLDHPRSLVHESCKTLLMNLLVVLSVHGNHHTVARTLLSNKSVNDKFCLTLPPVATREYNFINKGESGSVTGLGQSTFSVNSNSTITPDSVSRVVDLDTLSTTEGVAQALIEFIATRKCHPLWSYEDITSKTLTIHSAEQIERFLKYVVQIFKESLPLAHIEERWGQIALNLALSCSSRHYAGRSFQIFRGLYIPLTSRMLTDILSRLVETVAEQGEDMQGYVSEIMLTLEAAIDHLDLDFRPVDFAKELFMSTPNLTKEPKIDMRKSATVALRHPGGHHARSTSHTLSYHRRVHVTTSVIEPKEARQKQPDFDPRRSTNLSRSRSAHSLKNLSDLSTQDDRLTILSQMFWLATCLLESDYEYEFLLAIRLIQKVLKHLQPDRPECREKLDKVLQQMSWSGFPGLQAMLLKGCSSATTYECTMNMLSKLTHCINAPVIDPSQRLGFPMHVIALLPYLVINYESPNQLCKEAAENISRVCMEQSKNLDNLATVMTLYSRGTFARDSLQWTKCVVKYLLDVYSQMSIEMLKYLLEVLERGPSNNQVAVLHVLHCMVHYIDLTGHPINSISSELLRVVALHVKGPHWKEALKILKLVVTRSSTLAAPPPSMHTSSSSDLSHVSSTSKITLGGYTSFAEAEVPFKKELPGRTLEFTFDLSQVPVIGQEAPEDEGLGTSTVSGVVSEAGDEVILEEEFVTEEEEKKHVEFVASAQPESVVDWKKPYLSQGRTRERLVSLLTSYGQRVGLPKSPSDTVIHKGNIYAETGYFYPFQVVIFSQSSDTIERQPSMCSSSEETSLNDVKTGDEKQEDNNGSDQQFKVFKDFDFLDIELDSQEGETMDKFNLALKRPSFGSLDGIMESGAPESQSTQSSVREESSDDEASSASPVDDVVLHHQDLPGTSTITMDNLLIQRSRRPSSPMSASSHSISSDVDGADLSPSNASPSFSLLTSTFCHIQRDTVEEIWRAHVTQIMADSQGHHAVNSFQLFPNLYKETCRKLSSLTRESCYYLSKTEKLKPVAAQFRTMLEILINQAECPFVHVDSEVLISCKLLERHKFCVLEVNESYETYLMRKEQAVECLDGMKSSIKLQSLGENVSDFCGDEQAKDLGTQVEDVEKNIVKEKIELCKCLYKLHFQLLLLFESYYKLVGVLEPAAKEEQVSNVSEDVLQLKQDIIKVLSDSDSNQSSPVNMDINTLSRNEAESMVFECIDNREILKAVKIMRAMRSFWQGSIAAGLADDDLGMLLWIYSQQMMPKKPNLLVIVQPDHDINDVCRQMMDVNIQLSTSIKQLEQAAKVDREVIMRQPESSTL